MKKYGVIDNGNTRCKAGIFEAGELIDTAVFPAIDTAVSWLKDKGTEAIIASSVAGTVPENAAGLLTVSDRLKLPFNNLYATPATLGADRIAALAGAAVLYPGEDCLIFDIGTCMTIDFLSADLQYRGGNISPGLKMRMEAMHHFTGRLPLATAADILPPMGSSTLSALANGAFQGLIYEIEGYISRTLETHPNTRIILCGGDTVHFEKQLKYRIFANQNLVLQGLYHLLILNVKS